MSDGNEITKLKLALAVSEASNALLRHKTAKLQETIARALDECKRLVRTIAEQRAFIDDDEAGGPFVVVRQSDDDVDRKIKIDPTEWPMLKSAIDEMFEVCEQIGDA